MNFDQDLCLNLWYDPIGYFGKMNSTLGSVVPLAMFVIAIGTVLLKCLEIKFSGTRLQRESGPRGSQRSLFFFALRSLVIKHSKKIIQFTQIFVIKI